jgi:hypothetical protein
MPQHEGDYFPSIASYNTAAGNEDCRYPTDGHPFGYLVELDIETPDGRIDVLDTATFLPGGTDGDPDTVGTVVATRGERGPITILAQHATRAATAALTDYRRGDVTTGTRRIHECNDKPTT